MKKALSMLLALMLLGALAACSEGGTTPDTQDTGIRHYTAMTPAEVIAAVEQQKAVAVNVQIHTDMEDGGICLSADVQNNHTAAITNVTLAFAAWDIDGKAVEIESASGATPPACIKQVGMNDIQMEPGQTWVAEKEDVVTGFRVAPSMTNISYVKACVVSFELADGGVWNNPYYDEWTKVVDDLPAELLGENTGA